MTWVFSLNEALTTANIILSVGEAVIVMVGVGNIFRMTGQLLKDMGMIK